MRRVEPLLQYWRYGYAPVNTTIGDTFRPTLTLSNGTVLTCRFDILFTCSFIGMFIYITDQGLAHIGLHERGTQEQLWYELPSVWQYHDSEDDDTLSVPERRQQEIPFVYALAGM